MQTNVKIKSAIETKTYRTRWYILGLFSLMGFMEMAMWVTWGPIFDSSHRVFGWDNVMISLLNNYGNIIYVAVLIPFCWVMDVKGLRWAVVLSAALMVAGAGLRCISFERLPATILINLGEILNGAGLIVGFAAPPLISVVWFPPEERTTATGISASAGYLGMAASLLVGPLALDGAVPSRSTGNVTSRDIAEEKKRIAWLMYAEFAVTVVIGACIFCYFPAKPKCPPSVAASAERMSFFKGLKVLFCKWSFWKVTIPYSLAGGIYPNWIGMGGTDWIALGIDQTESGILAFIAMFCGFLGTIITSRMIDYIGGRMKISIIVLLLATSVFFVWLILLRNGVIPFSKAQLYISVTLASMTCMCTVPLFYELIVEISYPVAEGTVCGIITGGMSLVGTIFLVFFQIPNVGTNWMNYTMLGSVIIPAVMMIFAKEKYTRSGLDNEQKS